MSPRTSEQFKQIRVEKRQLIEDTALRVFAEEGYHNASVSKIAKAAGISKGLMYNYFESKEQLLRALMADVLEEATKRFDLPKNKSIENEDVIRFIDQSLELVKENPQKWKLFMSMFMQNEVMQIMLPEMMEHMQDYITPFVDYFSAKGYTNPLAATRYFHASIDGVQMQTMVDPDNFPLKEVKEMIIKQFVGS